MNTLLVHRRPLTWVRAIMMTRTPSRRQDSPALRTRLIGATVAHAAIACFLTACPREGRNDTDQPPPVAVDSQPPIRIDSLMDPELARGLVVRRDTSGDYVAIDDMRFRTGRLGVLGYKGQQWSNGALNYDLAPDVRADPFKRGQFEAACRRITAGSGIVCMDNGAGVGRPVNGPHFVYVMNDPSNYSYVGRAGGMQPMGIYNWDYQMIIAHEIKHALGWVHEHMRPDRDQFVRINLENIEPSKRSNFSRIPDVSTGTPYDFASIMHYEPVSFSINGQKTIEALPQYQSHEAEMGQRSRVSDIDLREVRSLYDTAGTEWCGVSRKPRSNLPPDCFFDCQWAGDPAYAQWVVCGSCRGSKPCR